MLRFGVIGRADSDGANRRIAENPLVAPVN